MNMNSNPQTVVAKEKITEHNYVEALWKLGELFTLDKKDLERISDSLAEFMLKQRKNYCYVTGKMMQNHKGKKWVSIFAALNENTKISLPILVLKYDV